MGFISSAVSGALQALGEACINGGSLFLEIGYSMWKACSKVTLTYISKNPMAQTNAWGTVTGGIWAMSMGIAASLAGLYFIMGWLRESIDIRNNFTLENMFRFFIRYILTASLLVNSLALVQGITECATAVVQSISVQITEDDPGDLFEELKEELDEDEASEWVGAGLVCLFGGLIGCLVILVCGVQIVLAVMSRLFKLLLCIPFAPVAFAGFAGGQTFSQTGIAWIRTFIGYALEAVVIALAIQISFGLFQDASIFTTSSGSVKTVDAILKICEFCMPMITAAACVKGAEMTVRRCLGLG